MIDTTTERKVHINQTIELIAYMSDIVRMLHHMQGNVPYKRDGLQGIVKILTKLRFPMSLTVTEYEAIKAAMTPYREFAFTFGAYVVARRMGETPAEHKHDAIYELLFSLMSKN